MAKHALNPSPDEVWFHPLTFNAYLIHSVTDDGWTRYQSINPQTNKPTEFTALWTQPTLSFINKYKRQDNE